MRTDCCREKLPESGEEKESQEGEEKEPLN
jgi:hypothetical protein